MNEPSKPTVKRLFALSGNQCAFPRCTTPIVDRLSGKVTGKICHIKARNPLGKRYDQTQMDEERHGFENLILLCPIHHDVVDDDEVAYTVERLYRMKVEHVAAHFEIAEPADVVVQQLIFTIGDDAVVHGPVVGQNYGTINYTAYGQGPAPPSRPIFSVIHTSTSRHAHAFSPTLAIRHVAGDAVPSIRYRFSGPRLPDQEWRTFGYDQIPRALISGSWDLRRDPRPDPLVGPDELGLEIEARAADATVFRQIHRWPLIRNAHVLKSLFDMGAELPTIYQNETPAVLAIEFRPEAPFVEVRSEGVAPHEREIGRLVRVGVRNLTGRTVRNVSVVLERFSRFDPHYRREIEDRVPSPLQVEGRPLTQISFDLPPRALQLVRIVERRTTSDLTIEMRIHYASDKPQQVPAVRHTIYVAVHAEDVTLDPQPFVVDVGADGTLIFETANA